MNRHDLLIAGLRPSQAKGHQMRAADIMTREVEVVRPEDSLQKAAMLMDKINVGFLPVSNGERVVGVITDRDIAVRAVAADLSPNMTNVDEVMTDEVHYCLESDTVADVVKHMIDTQIRRLLVFTRDSRLVGVISLGDIATHADEHIAAQVLRGISEPSRPDRAR